MPDLAIRHHDRVAPADRAEDLDVEIERGQGVGHREVGREGVQIRLARGLPSKAFYSAVLGWQFSPGTVEGGWGILGNGLEGGLWGGPGRQVGWKLMYAVDDLPSALERRLGGQAGEPESQPYGITAECVDNQGIEFWLWQQ